MLATLSSWTRNQLSSRSGIDLRVSPPDEPGRSFEECSEVSSLPRGAPSHQAGAQRQLTVAWQWRGALSVPSASISSHITSMRWEGLMALRLRIQSCGRERDTTWSMAMRCQEVSVYRVLRSVADGGGEQRRVLPEGTISKSEGNGERDYYHHLLQRIKSLHS